MATALECWQDAECQVRAGDALLERGEVAAAYRRYFASMEALVGALGAVPPAAECGADLTWGQLERVGARMALTERAMTALFCCRPCGGVRRGGMAMTTPRGGRAAWRTERSGR